MLNAIKAVFLSRGFWKAVGGGAAMSALHYVHAPEYLVLAIGSLFGVSVVAQGMSDFGKNAAK